MAEKNRPVQINLRVSERTDRQIEALRKTLSNRLGTKLTKTQAIETAVDRLLHSLDTNPEQLRFIDI